MSQNHKQRVIEEFQRRRKKMLRKFGYCIILVALALAFKQVSELAPNSLGMSGAFWSALATFQLIAGVTLGACGVWQYRCPTCEEIVRGRERDLLGVFLDPENCPKCGARLR